VSFSIFPNVLLRWIPVSTWVIVFLIGIAVWAAAELRLRYVWRAWMAEQLPIALSEIIASLRVRFRFLNLHYRSCVDRKLEPPPLYARTPNADRLAHHQGLERFADPAWRKKKWWDWKHKTRPKGWCMTLRELLKSLHAVDEKNLDMDVMVSPHSGGYEGISHVSVLYVGHAVIHLAEHRQRLHRPLATPTNPVVALAVLVYPRGKKFGHHLHHHRYHR
jgi:hypothetical protein